MEQIFSSSGKIGKFLQIEEKQRMDYEYIVTTFTKILYRIRVKFIFVLTLSLFRFFFFFCMNADF